MYIYICIYVYTYIIYHIHICKLLHIPLAAPAAALRTMPSSATQSIRYACVALDAARIRYAYATHTLRIRYAYA